MRETAMPPKRSTWFQVGALTPCFSDGTKNETRTGAREKTSDLILDQLFEGGLFMIMVSSPNTPTRGSGQTNFIFKYWHDRSTRQANANCDGSHSRNKDIGISVGFKPRYHSSVEAEGCEV